MVDVRKITAKSSDGDAVSLYGKNDRGEWLIGYENKRDGYAGATAIPPKLIKAIIERETSDN